MLMSLSDLARNRKPVEEVTKGLRASSETESREAAQRLLRAARDYGLNVRDYLTLAVDVTSGEHKEALQASGLNGYEAALYHLGLPLKDDLRNGVVLQAAADTFATYSGTRAMFPEVLDDMLRMSGRINTLENTASIVANTRVITQTEMISTFLDDTAGEDETFVIPEGGKIPVRRIGTSQTAVRMFKHGSGYEFTYEFNRRASLDIVTPFAARIARRLELSKVRAATAVLVQGEGAGGGAAATAETLGAYGGDFSGGKTLKDNYRALTKFLMTKAQTGITIDTLLCNFDTFVELMFMFTPTVNGVSVAQALSQTVGTPAIDTTLPILNGRVKAVLSSAMPSGKILAYTKNETLEELKESGSDIAENERSITTQTVTYVRSEVTGYRLALKDTRFLLDITQ